MRTPIFPLIVLITIALPLSAAPSEEIRLIVRGDDLGMTQGSVAAFEKAFRDGILTSASIQVPAPWMEAAAELASKHPEWSFGIHLTLIAEWRGYRWRPVLPWGKVKSITDPDGFLFRYPEELTSNHPRIDEIEAELSAQIALAVRKGIRPDYLDVHYVSPELIPGMNTVVERLAKAYRVPISGTLGEMPAPSVYKIPVGDKPRKAAAILKGLKPGLWLWVAHIGIQSPEQDALVHTDPADEFPDGVGRHRFAELNAITSEEVTDVIRQRGIRLTSYRDLR